MFESISLVLFLVSTCLIIVSLAALPFLISEGIDRHRSRKWMERMDERVQREKEKRGS